MALSSLEIAQRRCIGSPLIGTLFAILLAFLGFATPAAATTSQFRGMNWAQPGDNFSKSPLVIDGLASTDSYATVQAKANALYDDMQSSLGINTIRLPINTHTISSAWWNNYRGAIDAATARGWKVILAYWEDGAASGGRVSNLAAYNAMWSTVISQYGSNNLVYFEPMNEPHGYSPTDWRNFAANWLSTHSAAVRGRVLIGGTGYSNDLREVCSDPRFSDTLFSFHHYAFFFGTNTYDGWRSSVINRLGNCASRAVVTEFGAPMNSGLNYRDPNSTNNFVRHIRALTQVMRENAMGGSYWPALGGKPGAIGYDWYSMFAKSGTGTDLNLALRNPNGGVRLRYAFGDAVSGDGGIGTGSLINQNSGKCADIAGGSTANGAEVTQYTCGAGANQRWSLRDVGNGYYQFVSGLTGKCLDVIGASNADGAKVAQYTCSSGSNQQWQLRAVGLYFQLVARHSGKCLDVPAGSTENSTRLKQYECNTGTNQRWTI